MYRWFVVAEYSRWEHYRAHSEKVPSSLAHAKEMGTQRTACGIRCDTWNKWWELQFPIHGAPICSRCAAVTLGRVANVPSVSGPSHIDGGS